MRNYQPTPYSGYLIHYGVKGRSGKKGAGLYYRNGELTEEGKRHYYGEGKDYHKNVQKDAAKDAKEYARAKAYYGDGAGIRRKKIKNLISEKMKNEDYKKEFEKALASQNMEKHQKAANKERKIQNAKDRTARVGRGIKNLILGVGTTSMAAIALYNAAKMTGADKIISAKANKVLSSVQNKFDKVKYASYTPNPRGNAFAAYMNRR